MPPLRPRSHITKEQGRKERSDKKQVPDNFLSQLEVMSGLGLNGTEISHILGMSRASFERRKAEDPEITEALHRGRAKAKAKVHQTAYQLATSGKCPTMTQFWMKARSGWAEKQEISLTYLKEKYGVTDVNKLSDSQRIELAERCIAALRNDAKKDDDDGPMEA